MSEDIIKPESEYLRLTMAESNIVERLRELLVKLHDEVGELYNAMNDLFQCRYEALKTRFERVHRYRREFEDLYRHAMSYLVRVGIGLQHRDVYARIYLELLRFAKTIELVCFHLVELAETRASVDDDIVLGVQKLVDYVRSSIMQLATATQLLSMNASKALENVDEVLRNGDLCDLMYRDLYLALISRHDRIPLFSLVILRDLFQKLSESMCSLLHVAEGLRWIALHKV